MYNHPLGAISESSIFQEPAAAGYLEFLQRWDPIHRWEDITVLKTPVATRGKSYPIPEEAAQRLAHFSPNLNGICTSVRISDAAAPRLGLRYAFTRCEQHGSIVTELMSLLGARRETSPTIVDVGCFSGGLLHYLQQCFPQGKMLGFDLSPVALDVASVLSDQIGQKPKPYWLEGDFCLLKAEELQGLVKRSSPPPVIVICNVIEFIGTQLALSPAIDPWMAKAGLISYWVNQGATVFLCERHKDPKLLCQLLAENGRWASSSAKIALLREFDAWSTEQMSVEEPLGHWYQSRACVVGCFPE